MIALTIEGIRCPQCGMVWVPCHDDGLMRDVPHPAREEAAERVAFWRWQGAFGAAWEDIGEFNRRLGGMAERVLGVVRYLAEDPIDRKLGLR